MMRGWRGWRAWAVALLLVLGVAGTSVAALASIPGPDGVIHGCVKNAGDNRVIVVDSDATCPDGYTPLNWNQSGPPGLSGVTVVTVLYGDYAGVINCPSGKTALSVAFSFSGAPVPVYWYPSIDGQHLSSGQVPNGYVYTTAQTNQPTAYLTCALVS